MKSGWRSILGVAAAASAAAMWLLIAASSLCPAHPAAIASAIARIDADGHVRVRFTFDVLAYVLNDTSARIPNEPMDELLDGPVDELKRQMDDASARFAHSFQILADGGSTAVTIDSLNFPTAEDVLAWKRSATSKDSRLPVVLELSVDAHLPTTARTVSFRFPQVLDQVVLTVELPGNEPQAFALEAGVSSPEVPIALARPTTVPVARAAVGGGSAGRMILLISAAVAAVLIAMMLLMWFAWRRMDRRR